MEQMNRPATNVAKRRGRPPAFQQSEALEKAMQAFWQFGYEGTSMATLIAAMQMNKPSIYAAFGNKEALFKAALDHYVAGPSAFVKAALAAPSAYLVASTFLTQAIDLLTQTEPPRGCLIVQGALTCGPEAIMVKKILQQYRLNLEAAFQQRFEDAKTAHDLPTEVNTAILAKYILTVHQGLSVQAASGVQQEALLAVMEMALQNWPCPPSHAT